MSNYSANYHEIIGGAMPDWDAYRKATAAYLARPVFHGTPLTSDMLTNAAKEAYDKTGNYVPYDLALAQAQFESGMGRKGRNPRTNPYNVGEYDNRTVMRFSGPEQGVAAYYDLMSRRYLNSATRDDLMQNFVNDEGNRYASNPEYEQKLRDQMQYILKYVHENGGNR